MLLKSNNFFFAHPFAAWERGTNENTNGLVRQYAKKKMRFDNLSDEDVQRIAEKLNNRPRKCLGYRTPNEVFKKLAELSKFEHVYINLNSVTQSKAHILVNHSIIII